jgi:hypothetical protein
VNTSDLEYRRGLSRFISSLDPLRQAQVKKFLQHRKQSGAGFPTVQNPLNPVDLLTFVNDHPSMAPLAPLPPFPPVTPLAAHDPLGEAVHERDAIHDAIADLNNGAPVGTEFAPTPKNKTFTRVNPTYNKQRNVLGSNQLVIPGGNSLPVAWLQADEEDSTVFTITAFVSQLVPSTFGDQFRPYAKVTWGTRVTPLAVVTVDIGLGVQFSLAGSAAFVEVGAEAGVNKITTPVGVTGMLSFNTTQRQSPSQRTAYIDSLAAGLSKTFDIPKFAPLILSVHRDDVTAPLTLTMLDVNGATAFEFTVAANAFMTYPLQVSNDVTQVKVTNNGAGTIVGRVVFGLSL